MRKANVSIYQYDKPKDLRDKLQQDLNNYPSMHVEAMTTTILYYGWRFLGIKAYITTVVWHME